MKDGRSHIKGSPGRASGARVEVGTALEQVGNRKNSPRLERLCFHEVRVRHAVLGPGKKVEFYTKDCSGVSFLFVFRPLLDTANPEIHSALDFSFLF